MSSARNGLALADERQLAAAAAEVVERVDGERLPVQPTASLQRHEGMLEVGVEREQQTAAGLARHVGAHDRRKGAGGRAVAPSAPMITVALPPGSSTTGSAAVRLERRRGVAARLGKRHPELDAAQAADVPGRRLLRVGDAPPSGHQVEDAGPGGALEAEAVVVDHLAVEQPGDGLEADVGMGCDVHRLAGGEVDRAVGVEKAPGSDQSALAAGQQAADREAAEIGEAPGQGLERGPRGLPGAGLRGGRRGEIAHESMIPQNEDPRTTRQREVLRPIVDPAPPRRSSRGSK